MFDHLSANLAENLRRLREARGLTQQQLSDAASVPRPTLAHLESGSANPTLLVLARVAAALAVPMEELVAAPRSLLVHTLSTDLPFHEVSGVRISELCRDRPATLALERIELSPRARFEPRDSERAERSYLVCDRGEVEVSAGGEERLLHGGDVVFLRRGADYRIGNRGRGAALVFALKLGVSA